MTNQDIPGFEVVSEEGAPRIYRHVATSIDFRPIPGGVLQRGLSEDEEEALRAALSEGDDEDAAEGLEFLTFASELRPVHEVTVAPFLLAPEPLSQPKLLELLGANAPQELGYMGGCVTLEVAEQVVDILAAQGLRLPAEAEWEHTYRAGTRDPFPWGIDRPDTPWAPENRFGLEGMGEFAELCADGWQTGYEGAPIDGSARNPAGRPRVARGGAAAIWPWQDIAEWVIMLSAYRSSSAEYDGFLRIRPACSLV